MDSVIINCPCCGSLLQVYDSVLGARAYPFTPNVDLRSLLNANTSINKNIKDTIDYGENYISRVQGDS